MKKAIALLTAAVLLLGCSLALADSKLTVSGTGEVRISADTAVISLGVSARDPEVLQAQQKANAVIAAIRRALTDAGVKEEDINTDFLNIYPVYDYSGYEEKLSAYNASSTLAIHVTNMETIGALIDAAFGAGANTLNGISFSASDTENAENEALKKAVENAKKKAEVLAEAAGMKITGIEVITDGTVHSYENSIGNVYGRGIETAAEEAEFDAGTVVQAAKLVVSASVSITFTAE